MSGERRPQRAGFRDFRAPRGRRAPARLRQNQDFQDFQAWLDFQDFHSPGLRFSP